MEWTTVRHLDLRHLNFNPSDNQLSNALSCFDEAFLALAKDQSRGADIKAQATICAQYKTAVTLLLEIGRLQKVQGAKEEMARLSRHLGSLPILAKHRISCVRTAIKRNMEVQNYAYSETNARASFIQRTSSSYNNQLGLVVYAITERSTDQNDTLVMDCMTSSRAMTWFCWSKSIHKTTLSISIHLNLIHTFSSQEGLANLSYFNIIA